VGAGKFSENSWLRPVIEAPAVREIQVLQLVIKSGRKRLESIHDGHK
jgi:hypothetical protein